MKHSAAFIAEYEIERRKLIRELHRVIPELAWFRKGKSGRATDAEQAAFMLKRNPPE